MALTKEYFDSIQIDIVKKKYYNANKVHAVLEDIQRQADEMIQENMRLKKALEETEHSESNLISMQKLYRDTLLKAQERSDELLREAQLRRDRMLRTAADRAALASRRVEACLNAVKLREEQNIEFLNAQLDSFLSEVENEEEMEHSSFNTDSDDRGSSGESELLPDLESRISRLAQEIDKLESGET